MACKGSLILLADIEFTLTEFWVQIHGLSPITMLKENAITHGNTLGKGTNIDSSSNENLMLENNLRIRMEIDENSM